MPSDDSVADSPIDDSPIDDSPKATRGQAFWQRFCRFMIKTFYRTVEFQGIENIPTDGPVLLCANHVNALVDAVVVQAASPRPIHPVARSGLFRSPVLRLILRFIQAVPIYRRPPASVDGGGTEDHRQKNQDSFRRIFDYLVEHRVILIFPEGQSHSDPHLRTLKTGAARLALGAKEQLGTLPQIVPVGLTFTHKGRFRANVLVQFGPPLDFKPAARIAPETEVKQLTDAIGAGLEAVTLNVDSWEDLALLKLLQGFFSLRRSRRPSLGERFRSLQRLSEAHRRLRLEKPDKVAILRQKLQRFERLCRRYGVQDYHLELRYRPGLVIGFLLRCLSFVIFVVPLAIWGAMHSALPYASTQLASRMSAKGRDQYDTASMLFGLVFFLAFWGAQVGAVFWFWGTTPATFYALSLPITAAIALKVGYERRRILENVRVFVLFLRKGELKSYLRIKRQELEIELAQLARSARP